MFIGQIEQEILEDGFRYYWMQTYSDCHSLTDDEVEDESVREIQVMYRLSKRQVRASKLPNFSQMFGQMNNLLLKSFRKHYQSCG